MTESNNTPKTAKKSKRKLLLFSLAAVVLFVLAILVLPSVLSTSSGKNFILGRINNAIDGTVRADSLSLGWLSGIKLDKIAFQDTAGNTSLKVKHFSAKPHFLPLLLGSIEIDKTLIDQPELTIRVKPPTVGQPPTKSTDQKIPSEPASVPVFPIHKLNLEIRQGSAAITLDSPKPQTLQISNLSSKVSLNPAGEKSTLDLSMAVASGEQAQQASVVAKADITPAKGWTIKGTSGNLQLKIEKLRLEDIQPLLALAGKENIQIGGTLNATAQLKLDDGKLEKIDADASLENFSQTIAGQRLSLDKPVRLKALAAYSDNGLQIDNLNLQSSFCNLACSGTAENLKYTASADLATVYKVASQLTDFAGLELKGTLTAEGSINTSRNIITSSGKTEIGNLALDKGTLSAPPTPLVLTHSIRLDQSSDTLLADSVSLSLTGITLDITDSRIPLSAENLANLNLSAKAGIDLQKALPYMRLFAEMPADLNIAGLLNAPVTVNSSNDKLLVSTTGANVANLRISKQGAQPFSQDKLGLDANILIDIAEKVIDIQSFDLSSSKGESVIRILKGRLSSSEKNKSTSLAGSFQAQYDLAQLAALASPFLPSELSIQGKRTDSFDFKTTFPTDQGEKKLHNLDASTSFGFDKARYMGFDLGPANLSAVVNKGLLSFQLDDTPLNNGTLRFAGAVDLKQPVPMLKMTKSGAIVENVRINDAITKNLLRFLNPIFANAVNVEGVANLSCKTLAVPLAGGNTKDLVIDGNIAIKDIRLQSRDVLAQIIDATGAPASATMNLGPADFNVRNERVSYDNMPLAIGSTLVTFNGSVGLDKSIKMNAHFPFSLKGQKFDVNAPIGGTVDKPKIDIAAIVEELGKGLLEQNLREQLKKLF